MNITALATPTTHDQKAAIDKFLDCATPRAGRILKRLYESAATTDELALVGDCTKAYVGLCLKPLTKAGLVETIRCRHGLGPRLLWSARFDLQSQLWQATLEREVNTRAEVLARLGLSDPPPKINLDQQPSIEERAWFARNHIHLVMKFRQFCRAHPGARVIVDRLLQRPYHRLELMAKVCSADKFTTREFKLVMRALRTDFGLVANRGQFAIVPERRLLALL